MFSKCRVCLGLTGGMKFLTETEPEGKRLITMLSSIVNLEWIRSDRIASYLCKECESALEISYKFQKRCRESHEILIKFLEESDPLKAESDAQNDAEENSQEKSCKKATIKVSDEEVTQAVNEYRNKQSNFLKCAVCDYVLTTLRALSAHMTNSHGDIREKWCCVCNKIYNNLPEHQMSHKSSVEICKFCNKRIKKKYFVDHLRVHSGKRPFECRICSRGFLTNSSLALHYKYHNEQETVDKNPLAEVSCNDENAKNLCVTCNRTVRNLTKHVSKIHCQSSCHICGKKFQSNTSLQLHLRLHFGETPFKCTFCGKSHKSRAQMKDHERTHTGEKPHICSVCGKGFAQSGALGTHMRQHTGRPEVCEICQKRFCRPSELKLHLRRHSGEKPFLCTECGKAFVQKSHLNEHMKTHSDQRPHRCNFCEKAFKQKSLLTSHLQIHTGYKRFKCNVCSYACFKSYRLQQHMKLHSEGCKDSEKGHVCPICQKGFASQTLLNAHKSATHNAIL